MLGLEGFNTPLYATQQGGLTMQFSLQSKPVTVSVSGTVTDKKTEQPIANALVRGHVVVWMHKGPDLFDKCPYKETRTDAQGQYHLAFSTPLTTRGPMKGKDGLSVYISAPGYETKPQYTRPDVTRNNRSFTDFDFALEPGKRVTGMVVDQAGQPIAGAVVRVRSSGNADWQFFGASGRALTDEEGCFEIWPCNDLTRVHWLEITKAGLGSRCFLGFQGEGPENVFQIPEGGRIAGRVIDTQGNGISECIVSARHDDDEIDATTTDAAGYYVLKGVAGSPTRIEFWEKLNQYAGTSRIYDGSVTVYAQREPNVKLGDALTYKITAKDGATVTGPDLVVGAEASVSGRLIAFKTVLGLGGLMVRLDDKWSDMVETDTEGHYYFPYVSPGKHTLTAYLPHNLRYDRGIGQTKIDMIQGTPLVDVSIQLEELAEQHVRYLDMHGNPLPGITAGATWSKSGDSAWTEGTVSDAEGWAVLYLYPDGTQYIRGYDKQRILIAEIAREVNPRPAQILELLEVVMVPVATLQGCVRDDQGQPIDAKRVNFSLVFADGIKHKRQIVTEANGRFEIAQLSPGIIDLSCRLGSVIFASPLDDLVELGPGQVKDLGDIVLENGLHMAETIRDKHANAVDYSQEVLQAAENLFKIIRDADYELFLKEESSCKSFPAYGIYQTYTRYDILVPWICKTFKANPIVGIELAEVYISKRDYSGRMGLPTVPYRLTLKDGAILRGDLPFEYRFEGDKGYWHGIQGIDWHLQDDPFSK